VNVVTQHNDAGRTGQNTNETILTPANVNSSQFGQLFSMPVDGQVYAQPLYLAGVQIPGAGVHNVVFIATEHDSVYAFDADSNGGTNQSPLWQASFLSPAYGAAPGATSVPSTEIADDIVPEYGVTGTPVIDPVAGILYVVSFTQEGSSFLLRLHALSVTTGAEMLGGPVVLQAQVPGVGNGSSGGVLKLDAKWENQRPGLLLLNGVLYIGLASHADNGDWHGWILSYNPSTLAQISAICTSPNGVGSGVWMSGDGLAADIVDPVGHPFGRMFVATGNGDYNASAPYSNSLDYGDSLIGLDLSNGNLTVQDEFTPFNQAALDGSDGDLGSGGIVILPDQAGTYPHLLAQEGKGGTLYLINRDQMGGYNTSDKIVQEVTSTASGSGIWGSPAYWNGNLYIGEERNRTKMYSLANGVLSTSPTSVTPETYSYPGPSPSISANGNTNGILWTIQADSYSMGGASILHAYDATNLANELYSSSQIPGRDSAGKAVKFAVPTIANGKVYVGSGRQLNVYGLLNAAQVIASPVISPGSTTFTTSLPVTITDATPGATIYYTSDGSAPSTASTLYTGPITVNSTETITAIAVAPGYVWIAPVSATFTSLNNTANPVFTPAGGTYSTSPVVTITDASQGAIIYYTTDGSLPSSQSTQYTAPFAVTGSETISAIAYAPGLSGSAIVSQSYTTQSQVDFSQGFSLAQSLMTFNGSTGLDDTRLQLTNGYTSGTGSAFITNPLNIQAFTTNFLFQLSNPQADGITFTIQGYKPTALGTNSQGLGYATIPKSIAIKFDFYNDAGEGSDSTGVYVNGAMPTIPAINLSKTGIVLTSGDTMAANITYDGLNLAMTVIDQVTGATWSGVWQVNIPQIVGGNTAYVGFTGSTQILTASQKIATWTYVATTPGQISTTATPLISPSSGSYATSQVVTMTDATPGAVIYYTTDGTPPTTASNVYSAPFTLTGSATLQAMAQVPGGALSGATAATLAIASGVTAAVPSYTTANFFKYGSMIMNGAVFVGKTLQLTDGGFSEARSAYFVNPVNVQRFTSDLDYQATAASTAQGFTFVIQNAGLNAVGTALGYGFGPGNAGASIASSVAVGFDINGTAGEGADALVLYLNGAPSALPAVSLAASGIQLNSGHVIHAHLAYDGANLTVTLTDATTNATATAVFPVNIPATVGTNLAYVGFTGGTTANATATQTIIDWTYAVVPPPPPPATATPVISPASGTFTTPTAVTITDSAAGAVIYYTTDGTTPTTSSPVYSGPITVNASGTIQASALASGLSLSPAATAGYIVQAPSVAYASGFTPQGIALNGGATITGSLLQITDGGKNEARSAYFTSPLNVQAFTTTFDFQDLNAVADGLAFVIQNQGLTALGSNGAGLGYGVQPNGTLASIGKSVAVKFDLHSNNGEGNDSTGIYLNGASPTTPATDLTKSGVVFSSGHIIHAVIVYDGTNLTLTLTDKTTGTTVTSVYPVNIPAVVGANTAYFGFTGGTGGSSAVQNILDWSYSVPAPQTPPTPTPVIAPGAGTYAIPTTVTLSDSAAGSVIYYTTDGTTPTLGSSVYGSPIAMNATGTVQAIALAPGSTVSSVTSAALIIQSSSVSYTAGFTAQGLVLNGATVAGKALQLTDGGKNEARSAYFNTALNVQGFTTDFDFQLSNAQADGFTFVIQNQGLNAVGSSGGGLGYGPPTTGPGPSIGKSVALKFDIHSNSGEGNDSTGIYVNGALPTVPATNLTSTGVVLASGHVIHAHIVYNGTTLTLVLTDSTSSATATTSYAVNIPSVVGSNTAYVGFTGGTGGTSAVQDILDWSFVPVVPYTAAPAFSLAAGMYPGAQTVGISSATPGASIYYTVDGTTPTLSSAVYSAPLTLAATTTLQAIAMAPGKPASSTTAAVYSISSNVPSYGAGFQSPTLILNGGAAVANNVLVLTDGKNWEARSAYFSVPLNVNAFTTNFDLQILNGTADGCAFVIQNQGPGALGSTGAALGYAFTAGGTGAAITSSVAVKFDIHSNQGEGNDSIGIYLNGATPTVPATNLSPTGVVLNSGHVIHSHIVYDGTNLTLTLTDATSGATATVAYPVNIPSVVGSGTAYFGFTAGTGGTNATQQILNWTYTSP
jgi:hypothetical protein